MKELLIHPTKTTPKVDFNYQSGVCEMSGESYPENSSEYYRPIFDWLASYMKERRPLEFNFKMIYFNTSSSKSILDIIDLLEEYHAGGNKVVLNWFFETDDDDIEDSGREFTEDLSLPINIISY